MAAILSIIALVGLAAFMVLLFRPRHLKNSTNDWGSKGLTPERTEPHSRRNRTAA